MISVTVIFGTGLKDYTIIDYCVLLITLRVMSIELDYPKKYRNNK